ncbi:MAG: hypothetical protein ACI9LM_003455 [Alteromonadaceae bacterium]|jgi:hypothetical protein
MSLNNTCKIFMFLIMTLLLLSCFDQGENQGSNKLLINGSVLKGKFKSADLFIYNQFEQLLWQEYTNELGEFSAAIPKNSKGVHKVISRGNSDSTMVCDATACFVNGSATHLSFGEEIQANDLLDIEIKTLAYLGNGNQVKQLNALTSLTFDRFTGIENDLSETNFNRLAKSGSKITAASLGFVTAQNINLLSLNMLDITQPDSLSNAGTYEIIFSLINASFAKNLNDLDKLANVTQRLILNHGDLALQEELERIQKALLEEVLNLIARDDINVTNADVIQSINLAATKPIDFIAFYDAVTAHNFNSNDGENFIRKISASSTYWGASIRKKDSWWWVSGGNRGKPEWLELELMQPSKVGAFAIGLSNNYQGKNLRIQGFNEQRQWVNLFEFDHESFNDPDLKNVIHHSDMLATDGDTYSHLRLLSAPTTSLWLEYLCFFPDDIDFSINNPSCSSDNKIKVISTNTASSSNLLAPENIMKKGVIGKSSWWLSDMATGEDEWLMFEYSQPFMATSMSLTLNQRNVGNEVEIQASNDAENWQTLLNITAEHYQYEEPDVQGFITLAIPLVNNKPFIFYRYFSKPSAFLWIEHLAFEKY